MEEEGHLRNRHKGTHKTLQMPYNTLIHTTPTLYQLIEDWWCDIFCANSMDDMETCIDGLVDRIDKKFIPPSSDRNGYEWEKCLKIMREKLR
jgi:hypothetical protein